MALTDTQHEFQHESKTKLLDAALYVIRARGYSATRVEDICAAAGLTKGSFFHHFKSKEELALAAAQYFSDMADRLFAAAPYHQLPDPLDRLLGYVDFRISLLLGELPEYTCLFGTMVQEAYETHPAIREACDRCIVSHAQTLEDDIAAAMAKYNVHGAWTPRSLALYTQVVIQGSFVLAKAEQGPQVAADSLDHLRRYFELLFERPATQPSTAQSDAAKETQMTSTISLTTEPEVVIRPAMHYVFLEKTGYIPSIAQGTWQAVEKFAAQIGQSGQIVGACALYKCGPDIYRAGYILAARPASVPDGLSYEEVPGGNYVKFVLQGPYSQLAEATSRAFQLVAEKQVPLRDGFNIESYVTDPRTTPQEQSITEILFPAL
ncbi:MAG TPA: GyrI-like domain-containing protein [Terracidiphilus sp.]|nr:GyrI-like domain-containing protein [Terracidiphilus sp.]